METELKLTIPNGCRSVIEAHPAFGGEPSETAELKSTYFDTPRFELRDRGISVRLRQSNGRWIQTLKSDRAAEGGLGSRGEWEWELASEGLDIERLSEIGLGDPAVAGLFRRAEPVVTTRIRRTVRQLRLEGSTVVEAAIDEGSASANGSETPIHELELEVKHGPSGPAFRLGLELAALAPLRYSPRSKADRGFALLTGAPPKAHKAATVPLAPEMTLARGVEAILGSGLRQLADNIPAAEAGEIEGIHQMRIALRRIRTALVLFAPHLEPLARRRFNETLRTMGQVLGGARDWDVFATQTLPEAAEEGVQKEWLALLHAPAEARRAGAHQAVRTMIAGPEPTELLLGLGAWISDGACLADPDDANEPLCRRLPGLLDRMAEKMAQRGRHAVRLGPTELHDLRKSAKKLRYSVDDVAVLYEEDAVEVYTKKCKKLQSVLGHINDAAVTPRLAEELVAAHVGLAPSLAAVTHWNERRGAQAHDKVGGAWRRFRQAEPFWQA